MSGLKHLVVAVVLNCLVGCEQSSSETTKPIERQIQLANKESDTTGHTDLNRAIAVRAHAFSGGDLERTVRHYLEIAPGRHMVDLNGDGVNEAIATTTFTVDEAGKLGHVDGVTGNRPFCVFQKQDGKWTPILAEDFWCRDYSVEKTTINGWSLLSSMRRHSIAEYPVEVYAYKDGGYRIIYEHMIRPWEEQSESR